TAPRVLMVIAHDGFWYPDYKPVRDVLEQGRVQVTVASTREGLAQPRRDGGGEPVRVEILLDDVRPRDYDAVVFTCGNIAEFTGRMRGDTRLFIASMIREGKYVCSLCAGTNILAASGALRGQRVADNSFLDPALSRSAGLRELVAEHFVESGLI